MLLVHRGALYCLGSCCCLYAFAFGASAGAAAAAVVAEHAWPYRAAAPAAETRLPA